MQPVPRIHWLRRLTRRAYRIAMDGLLFGALSVFDHLRALIRRPTPLRATALDRLDHEELRAELARLRGPRA